MHRAIEPAYKIESILLDFCPHSAHDALLSGVVIVGVDMHVEDTEGGGMIKVSLNTEVVGLEGLPEWIILDLLSPLPLFMLFRILFSLYFHHSFSFFEIKDLGIIVVAKSITSNYIFGAS